MSSVDRCLRRRQEEDILDGSVSVLLYFKGLVHLLLGKSCVVQQNKNPIVKAVNFSGTEGEEEEDFQIWRWNLI